jgi:DNA topoisomerase-1
MTKTRRLSPHEDPVSSARAAELVYVTDGEPGIRRKRRGKGFGYFYRGREVKDTATLERIASLVIPPAWSEVWISRRANGHLQATGLDSKSRKQYRYHPRWVALRGRTKFDRLRDFGEALPGMRKAMKADLMLPGLPLNKVMALLVCLMEQTHIRIGNDFYRRLYGSYGLATLQCRHVKVEGTGIRFVFTGKKGVSHDITIHNRKLARIISRCKEIPGRKLFQYYDGDRGPQAVHSEDINRYIRDISGSEFTSKDFRTWAGTAEFIREFTEGNFREENAGELASLIERVASSLGNTRAVCRKYYIHPAVMAAFERGTLVAAVKSVPRASAWMRREERVLLKLLTPGKN